MHHLLNAGAAINMTDYLGNTALMEAVGCSAIPKYSLILKAGAQMYLLHQMKTFQVWCFETVQNGVKQFPMHTATS